MRIVFRTEASHAQGMGDLWGSLALADEFARHTDEVLLVVSGGDEAVVTIRQRGYRYEVVESFETERAVLATFEPDVVVVNKLSNPPGYIQALRRLCGLVVTIDDAGEGAWYADLRVNVFYHTGEAVTDPAFVTLRREFRDAHSRHRRIKKEVGELLITQGGSDTYGFTSRIVGALEGMSLRPHCTVVLGPAFRHWAQLEAALATSRLRVSTATNVGDMVDRMLKADLAITAGGLTMFELACVGTPSVTVCAERFESETVARMAVAGTTINLGFGGDLDYERLAPILDDLAADVEARQRMSTLGKALIDGRGCERVASLIRQRAVAVHGGAS